MALDLYEIAEQERRFTSSGSGGDFSFCDSFMELYVQFYGQ